MRVLRLECNISPLFVREDNISLPTSWIGEDLYDELMIILTHATVLVLCCRMIRIEL